VWGRLDLRMLWTVACVRHCPGAVDAQARRASVHVLAASRCSGREACAVLASRVRLCRGDPASSRRGGSARGIMHAQRLRRDRRRPGGGSAVRTA